MASNQTNLFPRANHSNLGREFENELCLVHEFYRTKGVADVVMNPRDWVFINEKAYQRALQQQQASMVAKTGSGRFMIRSRSDVDFSGGGKNFSICFDAKSCEGPTFPLANFTEHQIARLRQSARCGTIAGFMVQMKKVDRVFFVPVDYADKRYIKWIVQPGRRAKPGTASISIKEFEENAVEVVKSISGLWDWLPVLAR